MEAACCAARQVANVPGANIDPLGGRLWQDRGLVIWLPTCFCRPREDLQ